MGSTDKNNSKNNDNDDNYYVLGKTLVYFRPGILEYLETELLAIFDKCVIKIQQWYKRCKERQKNPNKNSDAKLLTWMEANKTQLNIIFISIFKIFAHQSEFAHQKEEKKIRTKGRIQSVANDTNALASRRRSKSPSINKKKKKKSGWDTVKASMDKKGQKVSKFKTTFVFNKKK